MKFSKKFLSWAWLLLPFGVLAYHFGPGQISRNLEQVESKITLAQSAVDLGRWDEAVESYGAALEIISTFPESDWRASRLKKIQTQLTLAKAVAGMSVGAIPEAIEILEELLSSVSSEDSANSRMAQEIRAALAKAQYYASWVMRLEGAEEDEWKPENEAARQNYRLLAESAIEDGDVEGAERYRKNLEAVIRMGRMDLSELQGLPLPKECSSCKNCSQKRRKQRESRSKRPKEGEQPPKDARDAGAGRRPDGSGS